ncbi:MAG: polysaccharide deacetylase family protein [bacterium]
MTSFPIFTTHGISHGATSPTHLSLLDFQEFLQRSRAVHASFLALKKQHFHSDLNENASNIKRFITFDDGLESVLEAAAQMPFPGTVFVVSGHVGKYNDWLGQPQWVMRERCMGWPHLKELIGMGWSVGAHTHSHADLSQLNPLEIHNEIEFSQKQIEDRLGVPCEFFAYPYGHAPAIARQIVNHLGLIGLGTVPGWVGPKSHLNHLPRIEIYDLLKCNSAAAMLFRQPTGSELNWLQFRRLGGSLLRHLA